MSSRPAFWLSKQLRQPSAAMDHDHHHHGDMDRVSAVLDQVLMLQPCFATGIRFKRLEMIIEELWDPPS